ncbi:MAG: 2-oxo acid dehydrogenase subunit E2 [Buchnera aphidicola (Chaetogeoica yunlongensis)]
MDIEVKMPELGIELVEVVEILVKIGDQVKKNDSIITVEGQKASIEIPTLHSGKIKDIKVHVGSKIATGGLILILNNLDSSRLNKNSLLSSEHSVSKYVSSKEKDITCNDTNKNYVVYASPIVRRLARKYDIKLENVVGSGRKFRILKEDVIFYRNKSQKQQNKRNYADNNKKMNYHGDNNVIDDLSKNIELTKIQRISSENLLSSWLTIPHVTQFDESDITELDIFRKKYNDSLSDTSKKLTILVFVIKAVAVALEKFSKFNSRLLIKKDRSFLVQNNSINIGIAVNTNQGLLVPVISHVNKKRIFNLFSEMCILLDNARLGKINFSDVQVKSSFTVSNLGGIGGTYFTPIINYPELAILGISRTSIKPYWNNDRFIPKLFLPLSLSYDHRAIDGVEAAKFITFISNVLSDIRLLLM